MHTHLGRRSATRFGRQRIQSACTHWPYWLGCYSAHGSIWQWRHALVLIHMSARRTLRREINEPKPSIEILREIARDQHRDLPFVTMFIPARNEAAVISNTIQRMASLDYPKDRYAVVVITDERERMNPEGETTIEIAVPLAKRINEKFGISLVRVIEVPEWHSGVFENKQRTSARSTKGRALNYALEWVREESTLAKSDMIGVLDADGRPHREVLREVAYRVMKEGASVLQGPVFQISNFANVGLIGKAAGIELSMYHLTNLPRELKSPKKTVRFLAGTNYFADTRLMIEVGGWNAESLVEDAELGLRLYINSGARISWLSCHEIEQTPPDRHTYLKQRERWALGHFQLLPIIQRSSLHWYTKITLYFRVMKGVLKSGFDIGLPLIGWIAFSLGWASTVPEALGWVMLAILFGSVFVWDYFGRSASMLSSYSQYEWANNWQRMLRIQFVLAMPWLILLQAQPRIVAFSKWLIGNHDGHWYKTKRTIEEDTEAGLVMS